MKHVSFLAIPFLSIASLGTVSYSAQVSAAVTYERLVFTEKNGKQETALCAVTAAYCSTIDASHHRFYVPTTPRPAGTTTHRMTFWLLGQGYFSHNGGHLATAVHGEAVLGVRAQGHGVIIGNVSLNTGGCGKIGSPQASFDPPRAQFESYWATGNWVDGNSCSNFRFADNTWYFVVVEANQSRQLSYQIFNQAGALLDQHSFSDTYNPVAVENYTGVWFGQVSSIPGTWRMQIDDITVDWH
jgi:hypothetical protein